MRRTARNLLLVTGSRMLDGAVRFFTVPLVLGYFGRADFGLIALAFSIHGFLMITDFGISLNAVRRFAEYLGDRNHDALAALVHSASFFYLVIGLVNLLAVTAVGVFGRSWFQLDERQAEAFFWMMLSLGVSSAMTWAFSIYRQVLHAAGQVGWDESINLFATLLTLVLLAATLYWRLGVALYFTLVLLPPLLPLALRVRRVRQLVPGLQVRFVPDWLRFKPLVGTSLLLLAFTLAEVLANNWRPVILAQRAGLESVADFRVIQQISGFATLMLGSVFSTLYPTVARLDAAGNIAGLGQAIRLGSRLLLWAHLMLLVPMAFLAPALLRVYVGRSFEHLSLELGIWLISLLAYHNAVISSIVLARGRLGALTLSAALAAVVTLAAAYATAPQFGVMAVVVTYAAYMAVQLAVIYVVALPRAVPGEGWATVRTVVPAPVLAASILVVVLWVFVTEASLPVWWVGVLFVPLFAALALWPGRARSDWLALKGSLAAHRGAAVA